jgi:hypothetical protein
MQTVAGDSVAALKRALGAREIGPKPPPQRLGPEGVAAALAPPPPPAPRSARAEEHASDEEA